MKRALLAALMTAVVLLPVSAATDALTDARAALGGDAALSQITSIHAVGKIVQTAGTRDGTVEVYFRTPDRFARVTRVAVNPSGVYASAANFYRDQVKHGDPPNLNFSYGALDIQGPVADTTVTTTRVGFAGSTPISGGRGGALGLGSGTRQYAAFAIPLLAQLTSAYPATVSSSSEVVTFESNDGFVWTLAIDPATHLPATLSWTGGTATGAGAVSTLSDFRTVGRVMWPFRLITRTSTRLLEDVTIKKYEINTKIDDKMFR